MTVTVDILKTVYGGDGMGRLGDGRVVFVPGAFAGETVRAEIEEQKRRYVKARLVSVEKAIPGRTSGAAKVPGMVYADVDYADEMRFKQDQLENFLWKIAGEVLPLETVPAASPLNYRNKATYHLERQGGDWAIGYREEPGHRVVDVKNDPLAVQEINAALPSIRAGVKLLLTQGSSRVRRSVMDSDRVTVRWTSADGVKWWLGAPPRGMELRETTAGHRFVVDAGGFYQVNPVMGDTLVKTVVEEYLRGADEAPHILDLYCGVGVFGLCCAKALGRETGLAGVESARDSVACAKRNAAALGVRGAFFCERVGGSLSRIRAGSRHTVMVDPPRGGLERNVAPWLARLPAPRIFYVSCDPATLARDLQILSGGYRIERVWLIDMFPRTARFETVVAMRRRR